MPAPVARRSRPSNRVVAAVLTTVAVLALGVGGVIWHASSGGPLTDKERIAHRFVDIRSGDGLPASPPFSSRGDGSVDTSARVQEFVAQLNVPQANADLRSLQHSLTEWSHDKITDEAVYDEMGHFVVDIRGMQEVHGPSSESVGLAHSELYWAIEDYLKTFTALRNWISTPSPENLDTYMKQAGVANAHWDKAIHDLYAGAGEQQPKSVHKHT
jgi:hypothetical protein